MIINCDYNHKKEEFYNKVNRLFDNLETINGGKFSRKLNEAKNRVDFNYSPYELKGYLQLHENKVTIEGKIPPYVPSKFNFLGIAIANLLAGHDTTKSINNSRENIEKNFEYAIESSLKGVFN